MEDTSLSAEILTRPLLILDLDETLVHTVERPLSGRTPDFGILTYSVYLRPHLQEFLRRVSVLYDLAIWSAGGALYVEPTVSKIFDLQNSKPVFVWSANRCTRRYDPETGEAYYIKDFKKIRAQHYNLARTLIVDDLERNSRRNYGNAIIIRPFNGSSDDCELLLLSAYLESIAHEPNFRSFEKRFWREQAVLNN